MASLRTKQRPDGCPVTDALETNEGFVSDFVRLVAEIFEISHFNLVFQVFPTVREALGAVSADAANAFAKG